MSLAITGSETHESTSVTTAECLSGLKTAAMDPGELAFVQDTQQYYFYDPESALPLSVDVVATDTGCGRWIRTCVNCNGTGGTAPTGATGTGNNVVFLDLGPQDVLNDTGTDQVLMSTNVFAPLPGMLAEIHFDASGQMLVEQTTQSAETYFKIRVNGVDLTGTGYSFPPMAQAGETNVQSASATFLAPLNQGNNTIEIVWHNLFGTSAINEASSPNDSHASLLVRVQSIP